MSVQTGKLGMISVPSPGIVAIDSVPGLSQGIDSTSDPLLDTDSCMAQRGLRAGPGRVDSAGSVIAFDPLTSRPRFAWMAPGGTG